MFFFFLNVIPKFKYLKLLLFLFNEQRFCAVIICILLLMMKSYYFNFHGKFCTCHFLYNFPSAPTQGVNRLIHQQSFGGKKNNYYIGHLVPVCR